MSNDTYKPIRIDGKAAVAEAKQRLGFTEAWGALEDEYAALSASLEARQKALCDARINPPGGKHDT